MLISVQTKRVAITPRKRQAIKAYVRRLFERQRWDISRCVVSIEPEVGSDDTRLTCDIRLWSAKLGLVVVRDTGDTIRTVVQRAATRAREVVRRRVAQAAGSRTPSHRPQPNRSLARTCER